MHVLLGLLQLEQYDRARAYIRDVESDNENIRRMVSGKIKNATISALLLGKYNRAKEEGIELYLTEDSMLELDCGVPEDDLIVVIGNLIENAIEAISRSNIDQGEVQVYIRSIDDEVVCQVIDNGSGMTPEQINTSFQRGVTTKPGSAGIGLDLVAKTLDRYDGSVTLESALGQGTEATAVFKRGK
jgi:two-component system CitB family sensor kinase/two-component system sensor histidine kinase DctS